MQRFEDLAKQFAVHFNNRHFPEQPSTLYDADEYFLGIGGKRFRPVLCLMGNELFDEIKPDAYQVATAIELFHNFTLIHDDIMDNAPIRRNMPTVHEKYGSSTALLAGDVMLVVAYDYLLKIKPEYLRKIANLFGRTAREVCEGQQLDMDFEKREQVGMEEYIHMIELKTSVLVAASLRMGGVLGGAGERNLHHLYEFGRNLGIAFQVQDDYLDCFGDPAKFGKQAGGDIVANKKTFLLIKALESADPKRLSALKALLAGNSSDKVQQVLDIFRYLKVDQWAFDLKDHYLNEAYRHLDEIAVVSDRKAPLQELAQFLVQREY
jgi:geranylgeranyl diphosphate synthase, type II